MTSRTPDFLARQQLVVAIVDSVRPVALGADNRIVYTVIGTSRAVAATAYRSILEYLTVRENGGIELERVRMAIGTLHIAHIDMHIVTFYLECA